MGYRMKDSSSIHCRCRFEARLHKTWKAPIRFVRPSTRPSFRTYQCVSHRESIRQIWKQVLPKLVRIGRNLDILHIDLCTFRCCRLYRFPTKALLSNSIFELLTVTDIWTKAPQYWCLSIQNIVPRQRHNAMLHIHSTFCATSAHCLAQLSVRCLPDVYQRRFP